MQGIYNTLNQFLSMAATPELIFPLMFVLSLKANVQMAKRNDFHNS